MFPELVMLFLVTLIGFFDFANGTDSQLRRQTELLSDVIIAILMQNILVGYLLFISNIRDIIAGSVKGFHSFQKLLLLFLIGLQFEF